MSTPIRSRIRLPSSKIPPPSPSSSSSSSIERDDRVNYSTPRDYRQSNNSSYVISDTLKKQFKRDIESCGGLTSPDIARQLFDVKPDIYGSEGSTIRKKFAKLLSNWKHRGVFEGSVNSNSKDKKICSQSKSHLKMSRNDRSLLAKFCPIGFELDPDDGQLGK